MSIISDVRRGLIEAAGRVLGYPVESLVDVRPGTKESGADLQSGIALENARSANIHPIQLAEGIVRNWRKEGGILSIWVSGPGFINFRIDDEWISSAIATMGERRDCGIIPVPIARRVVVDYSSPNVAKEMHVGHLRSSILGDALSRMLTEVGHVVIRQNHVGDWGTPFGMLIEGLIDDGAVLTPFSITDLNAYYRSTAARYASDPGFAERARKRVVALQAGDPLSMSLWREFVNESKRHFREVYDLLGLDLADSDIRGESAYGPDLDHVTDELLALGIGEESSGAVIVRAGDGGAVGIIRKSDGGYTYDATDLAAIRYRVRNLQADQLLYVVGAPQAMHFQLLFNTARRAGWLPADVDARHVAFGSVLGDDGKMLRTRSGDSVRLQSLLEEAIGRAYEFLEGRSSLEGDSRHALARYLGVGAVKYADLSCSRQKDYIFSWNKMLSLRGNTSVYIQYAHARVSSLLARANGYTPVRFQSFTPEERALALELLRFSEVLDDSLRDLEPHKLCHYLYNVSTLFTTFYETSPILRSEDRHLRNSRLSLSDVTGQVLRRGLHLLGIDAPYPM